MVTYRNNQENKRTLSRDKHNKFLWKSFKLLMDIDHRKNLNSCNTLGEQEDYLNSMEKLFRQYAANYSIPRKAINKSDAYTTLRKFTNYNLYSKKYNHSIYMCITQLEMCAVRKTTSKRAFTKNKLILKRELTCVQHADKLPMDNDYIESEWEWLDTKYHKQMETNSNNTTNKWIPAKKWTLVESS